MKRLLLLLFVSAAAVWPSVTAAQCPVEPGWWTYRSGDGRVTLKFHVRPAGTSVDSLQFVLHSVCNSTGTKTFASPGKPISCAPWGFTWTQACNTELWIDGFDLEVSFSDSQRAGAILDIVTWFEGCAVCRALTTTNIVGTSPSTWGGIKTLYDSPY
jgi:hypothetical protein